MRGAYQRALGRLLGGGALLYAGATALLMGLLVIWANFQLGENTLSGPLAYLARVQELALPLFAMDAYGRDRRLGLDRLYGALPVARGRLRQGVALAYLSAYALSCLPLALVTALVLPQGDSWAALAGYLLTGGAMLSGCLLCASWARGRAAAFGLGFVLTTLWQAAPLLAAFLDQSALGAHLARVALYLSPAARFSAFLNGSLDLAAAGFCLAIVALSLFLLGGTGRKRALQGAALWALASVLLALTPASLTALDMTPQRVTTPSERMELLLSGLNREVTVYQVAPVGEQDPWVELYLKKLAERHKYLHSVTLSPREDEAIAALDLPAGSLVVEQAGQWAVLRYENLYQYDQDLTGRQVTFELEGALLAALDEVTGLTMADMGVPRGPRLSQTYTIEEEARSQLTVGLVLTPLLLLAAGAVLALFRKRYERKN